MTLLDRFEIIILAEYSISVPKKSRVNMHILCEELQNFAFLKDEPCDTEYFSLSEIRCYIRPYD